MAGFSVTNVVTKYCHMVIGLWLISDEIFLRSMTVKSETKEHLNG